MALFQLIFGLVASFIIEGRVCESFSHHLNRDLGDTINELEIGSFISTNASAVSPRQTKPAVIEIFVFVDSFLANTIGDDNEIYKYMSATWNVINRRYRAFQNPPITIKLVGVKIARYWEDERFLMLFKDDKTIDYIWTLGQFARWLLYHRNELPPHDIAYLQTDRPIKWAGGAAYSNNACYDSGEKQMSTAFGADWGEFDGIKTAAHEIGHTLGCDDYDGNGATCPMYTNNIMNGPAGIDMCSFSKCSHDVIENYVNKWGMEKCFGENVGSAEYIKYIDYDILPGDMWTMDKMCRKLTGYEGSTCVKKMTNCNSVTCTYSVDDVGTWNMDALTGTRELCPDGQRCLDCVCK